MFQYQFDNDSGEYAIAKQQAENYPGDDPESKIKGNLGEIAFKKLCQYTLDVSTWHWRNEREVLRGEQEYNDYDFALFGKTVDVKARSRLDSFFDLDSDSVSSEYVALVWVPPRVTESVLESDSLINLSRIHPREHDPAVIFGFCASEELNSETKTLHHPDPGGPMLSNIPVQPFWQPIFGENLDHTLAQRGSYQGREQIGHWRGHADQDGNNIIPGVRVDISGNKIFDMSDKPDKGLVVECLTEPGGAEFDPELQKYNSSGTYALDSLNVGIVDERLLSEEKKETCSRYFNSNLYPLISGVVADEMEIHTVPTDCLSRTGSLSMY
jgi:hypothetical protein